MDDPKLARQQKCPAQYEQGRALPKLHYTAKEVYYQIYYEALKIVQTIRDRFDQTGHRVYQCLGNLILKAAKQEEFSEEFKLAVTTYGCDIHESNLWMQLQALGSTVQEKVDMRDYLKKLTPAERLLHYCNEGNPGYACHQCSQSAFL